MKTLYIDRSGNVTKQSTSDDLFIVTSETTVQTVLQTIENHYGDSDLSREVWLDILAHFTP